MLSPRMLAMQFRRANAGSHETYQIAQDPSGNMQIWWVLLRNLPAPQLAGREFLFKLTATASFPIDPPTVQVMSPGLPSLICLQQSYIAARGLLGAIESLINIVAECDYHADASTTYNHANYGEIMQCFSS